MRSVRNDGTPDNIVALALQSVSEVITVRSRRFHSAVKQVSVRASRRTCSNTAYTAGLHRAPFNYQGLLCASAFPSSHYSFLQKDSKLFLDLNVSDVLRREIVRASDDWQLRILSLVPSSCSNRFDSFLWTAYHSKAVR